MWIVSHKSFLYYCVLFWMLSWTTLSWNKRDVCKLVFSLSFFSEGMCYVGSDDPEERIVKKHIHVTLGCWSVVSCSSTFINVVSLSDCLANQGLKHCPVVSEQVSSNLGIVFAEQTSRMLHAAVNTNSAKICHWILHSWSEDLLLRELQEITASVFLVHGCTIEAHSGVRKTFNQTLTCNYLVLSVVFVWFGWVT